MAFTRLRRRPLEFVDERPEHDIIDTSLEEDDSSGEDYFIKTNLKGSDNADEFWDSGFSSPPNCSRNFSMQDDESPMKGVLECNENCPITPPFSPPSLGGLRLFDTPHTPRSLLQRSSCSGSPEPKAGNRKLSRHRRVLGGRPKTDPRANAKTRLTANVNPFTPDLNVGFNGNNKRTRKIR
jgi:wee1-like protein kinase